MSQPSDTKRFRWGPVGVTACLCLAALITAQTQAIVEPGDDSAVAAKAFKHPDLTIEDAYQSLIQLDATAASKAHGSLDQLGVAADSAFVDVRGGRFETLMPVQPLLPGKGVGNDLSWSKLDRRAPQDDEALRRAAWDAFAGYLEAHSQALGIDLGELSAARRVTIHAGGDVVQIFAMREIGGVPVRDSYLTAVINHGNLSLLGFHRWGDARVANQPSVQMDQALATARDYLGEIQADSWGKPHLIVLPMARGHELSRMAVGEGYSYRLAWSIRPRFDDQHARWEMLLDAHSGEVLSFEDTNHYAEAKGGVYPVTNDGVVPDGVEQAGWPMPFNTITHSGGTAVTDTGGNIPGGVSGNRTSVLDGPFVRMNDNCGAISLSSTGDLDFGTSGGDDCTTPGFGGAGNTHSSRTGFYELNKLIEMAQGWLPGNSWLQQQLTSNMNINQSCNAFWNGSTVNFYRSGNGCANTGEIAGVFVHEWGHGMDNNDTVPTISSPSGEGIADIYTALRLNTSCIGRNFRTTPCTGFGDPCLSCTGVRDIDYEQRQSGQPHDYSWSNANCGSSVHCRGAVYSEAVWSLWKRNLQQAPYNYDNNTAHEIVNRLTFLGAGNVSTWFSGGPPFGGCGSGGGYLNYLAVDDDDGNLNNGTPHMQAIFHAFNDQEIACPTPAVQDSGCAGVPTTAPNVTASPDDRQVGLSWSPVAGATSYEVFRAEGIFACDFGKVRVGSTTGTSFTDSGLQNGRDYSYVVIPKRGASCFGPASACDTVQPGESSGCSVNADCDDGAFCNGAETCNAGTCQPGTPPTCDDGAFCNGTETCNEVTDSCDSGSDPCNGGTCDEANDLCVECSTNADCNDGAFCNGTETCNAGTCVAGTPVVCSDGAFCNGVESCNEATDSCAPGTPVNCNDGVSCTVDSCNENTNSCNHVAVNSLCSDGAFCNGTETCHPINDCQAGTPPCGLGETCNETQDTCEGGIQSVLWMSFESNTTVPGVGTVRDEDIVSYDEITRRWKLEFDGSDVGLAGHEISGLAILPNGNLLLSFSSAGSVGGVSFDDSDIVRFVPTSLGWNTSGSFSLYFDGSDVGLTKSGEDVDGIALAADGRLVITTTDKFSGVGASGADEDLFIFTGTLGSNTSGFFRLHFDGSDVGLGNSGENVDAAAFTRAGTLLYSTNDRFSVPGLSGADEDIVEFRGTFGSATSGSHSMRLDLSTRGISSGENVRSLFIVE